MKKILIIEDNQDIRENLEELLEMESYQVISAQDGIIGTKKALSENPDFILCDITMPKKNGYEVLASIQTFLSNKKIPFAFLTANAQERDIAVGKNLGVDAYITKPFHYEDLLKTIQSLIV